MHTSLHLKEKWQGYKVKDGGSRLIIRWKINHLRSLKSWYINMIKFNKIIGNLIWKHNWEMATDYWSSTSTPENRKLKSRQANAFNDINKHYFWIKDPREENISYLKNSLFWWRHLHDWSSSSKIFRKQKWLLKVKILPYP